MEINTECLTTTENELCGKMKIRAFFENPKIHDMLLKITKHKLATFQKPLTAYQKIVNILNVSLYKKQLHLQEGKVSCNCPILLQYNDWKQRDFPLGEIEQHLDLATKNMEEVSRMKITNFFRSTIIKNTGHSEHSASASGDLITSTPVARFQLHSDSSSQRNESNLKQVLEILSLSPNSFKDIETFLSTDGKEADLELASKNIVTVLKSFNSLNSQLERITQYEQRNSDYTQLKKRVMNSIEVIKGDFKKLSSLCDKSLQMESAKSMGMAEFSAFIDHQCKSAQDVSKSLFKSFFLLKPDLEKINTKLRKRLSNLRNSRKDDVVSITSPKINTSWEECMDKIHDDDWHPNARNGMVSIDTFLRVRNMFMYIKTKRVEYVTPSELFEWIGVVGNKTTVARMIVENLPVIRVDFKSVTILIDAEHFLKSGRMITELLSAASLIQKKQVQVDSVDMAEAQIIGEEEFTSRKAGSGRPNFVTRFPSLLGTVREYAESTGLSAHSRRRDTTGRIPYGFNISDVQKHVRETLFKDNPTKAPSLSTLRRLFEPPNKATRSSQYYKGFIPARPGTKRNDLPSSGRIHKHRHLCFHQVKMCRELFSLFRDECCQLSCDDKVYTIHTNILVKYCS